MAKIDWSSYGKRGLGGLLGRLVHLVVGDLRDIAQRPKHRGPGRAFKAYLRDGEPLAPWLPCSSHTILTMIGAAVNGSGM